ncbi:MAG: L-lactate dehydrogenase [Chloroflexi bacterium RBG_19FT_COMBO_47_9]|nr:MAG: L-lactate dehydrogenase [Chloroflexi bacterium RBG_19FT_COMBO_47_9]
MKVGIVGAGLVGATTAYALVMRGVGREIVLVDVNQKRAQAEADDILHAVPFAYPLNVSAGDYPALAGSTVVVITAGAAQQPGQSRLQLLKRNAGIFRTIIPQIIEHAPEAILLVATNPVDVLTHLSAKIAEKYGIPSNRVIGSGTTLDTARLRSLLGQHLGVDAYHVHGYVLGEHGDSEVIPWSLVTLGGVPLDLFCDQWKICTDDIVRGRIESGVRNAAYQIIQGKGSTYYGIGSSLAKIVEVILRDQRSILTVCTPVMEVVGVHDVTISLPHLVGGGGIHETVLLPIALSKTEQDSIRISAQLVSQAYLTLDNSNVGKV